MTCGSKKENDVESTLLIYICRSLFYIKCSKRIEYSNEMF